LMTGGAEGDEAEAIGQDPPSAEAPSEPAP
jgi:hypothetical protein